ncbi:MAG TPA: SpoIIE family protein phosphatase [Terriglobales bacterium]|nr:SpoIIE family protein phosphatase [Terriglobales bacterium]
MTHDDAVALLDRVQDATRRHDVSHLMEFYADDALAVTPMLGEMRGRDAIRASWLRLFEMFPDIALTVSEMIVEGGRIAVIGQITATDKGGGWFGLAPTGGVINYRIVLRLDVVDGKIVRDERIYDSAGVVERLQKAHLDKELRTAAEVQRALAARGSASGTFFEFAGDSLPCRTVGGDFFDFLELPSGSVGIAIGDVAGKGPAAALLAALIQGMLAVEAEGGGCPASVLERINQRLSARRLDPRFATLVYGVLSPDGGFVYSNAGHNPPALITPDGIQRLTIGGPILGSFREATFEQETLRLGAGETLLMFTDGVTEASDPDNQEFGEVRLLEVARSALTSDSKTLLRQILAELQEFCRGAEQADDITLAISRFI